MFLRADQVSGQIVELRKTNPLHFDGAGKIQSGKKGPEESFGEVLMRAFENVNGIQEQTEELSQKMITDPEEVSVHDVMISMAESNLAINMAKTIANRAIQAYKEIIAVR
jgi:flagellar hook-basal body complex protein FliE